MKYAKIENSIVVQVQPNKQDGFLQVDDYVIAGMIKDKNGDYYAPALTPTTEELIATYRTAVGQYIDSVAVGLGFDSIVTAVTYADEPADERNQQYGIALRSWRSECWKTCRDVLVAWQGGTLEEEITEQGLIDKLPAFKAPAL